MKTPYLHQVSSFELIKNLLVESLNEMLKIKDRYRVVPFSYPGWEIAKYTSDMAERISKSMRETGERLAREQFKKFDEGKTKLTKEIVEEMWMSASKSISSEIYAGYDEGKDNHIGGLNDALEEGAIMRTDKPWEASELEMETARDDIKKQADKINYQDDLLRRFREKFFKRMQSEFGLFTEQKQESTQEFMPKVK
ncbi:MAG: hypothetical protein ABI430_04050 [Candidatus Taylorbacteria bacterium]